MKDVKYRCKVNGYVSEPTFDQLVKLADEKYDGNMSMAVRRCIQDGLDLTSIQRESIKQGIKNICSHVFGDWHDGNLRTCNICGTVQRFGP